MNILFQSVEVEVLSLNPDGTYKIGLINLDKQDVLNAINEFEDTYKEVEK